MPLQKNTHVPFLIFPKPQEITHLDFTQGTSYSDYVFFVINTEKCHFD